MKAKILFAAEASSKRNFGDLEQMTQSLFSVTEAVEFFQQQRNWRGVSSCYMTLSCMYASQIEDTGMISKRNFKEAIMYVMEAKKVMNYVMQERKKL